MVSKLKIQELKKKYPDEMKEIRSQAFRKAIDVLDKDIVNAFFNKEESRQKEQERIINIFKKYCKSPAVVFDDEGFLKEVKEDEK